MINGWSGIGKDKGVFVAERDGFDYARRACGITSMDASAPEYIAFRDALVEWFFSGEWVRDEKEDV